MLALFAQCSNFYLFLYYGNLTLELELDGTVPLPDALKALEMQYSQACIAHLLWTNSAAEVPIIAAQSLDAARAVFSLIDDPDRTLAMYMEHAYPIIHGLSKPFFGVGISPIGEATAAFLADVAVDPDLLGRLDATLGNPDVCPCTRHQTATMFMRCAADVCTCLCWAYPRRCAAALPPALDPASEHIQSHLRV